MAETSKRNWPWKKKTQEKISSVPESIESSPRASPHNSKFFDEQDVSKILSDHARVSDEAMTQWQHSESKLKQLSDKLHAAQAEITTKDMLVKQHAKVAEEAVTGWEKAEAEASAMKKQLDTALHQKLATEDRVSHLDGALKECMRQLRHVREEQEVRIHETIIKKTREYDKLRQDMEAKLAEAGQNLQDACSEAVGCRAEAHAMSVTLQERTQALAEAMDVKGCAEAEIKILQAQLEAMEKEKSTLKYELHLVSKEVEIRNVERDCERRAAESAGKSQLENVKRIAKLEAECQKLRILVRTKLPGPAALAQMKIEVDALSRNSTGVDLQRKRPLGPSASTSSRDLNHPIKSSHGSFHDSYGTSRDADVLSERLLEMDDELKMLKEALAKRDEELQASRLMCAKTASKLSNTEEQLVAALDNSRRKSSHLCSICQKQYLKKKMDSADPWNATSALLAELTDFKKLDVGKLDLVDDFKEIERLAMATEKDDAHDLEIEASEESCDALAEIFEKKLIAKQAELDEANSVCKEVSQQLLLAKEQLSILQSRNGANEAALVRLQEKMDRLCDKQGEDENMKDRNITKELEELVEAQSISVRAGVTNEVTLYDPKGRSKNAEEVDSDARRSVCSRSSSELRYVVSEHSASFLSDTESKASTRGSDLLATVRSVVQAVEALAEATGLEHRISSFKSEQITGVWLERQVYPFMHWKDSGLDCRIQSLIGTSNKLLQGETDMVEFLVELTAVVNYLVKLCGRNLVPLEESRVDIGDWPNFKETEVNFETDFSAIPAMKCHTCPDGKLLEGLEDLETGEKENPDIMVRLTTAEKRVDVVDNQAHGVENPMSEGSNCLVELSKTELDRDMLMLLNKVVVLEEELADDKRQHREVAAKYHELQENIHSGGAGIDSQDGSLPSKISERVESHNAHKFKLDAGEIQLQEREIQSASEKLAECQRSILDLGERLKVLSCPLD